MGALRKAVSALALIVLCFSAAAVFLASSRGERIIRDTLTERLGKALKLDIRIESLETDLFSSLTLHGIRISLPDTPDSSAILTCDDVGIDFRIWRLMRSRPSIDSLGVSGLAVNLKKDENGWKLPSGTKKTTAEPSSKPPLDAGIRFSRLCIEKSSLSYNDTTVPLALSTGNVAFDARAPNDSSYAFTAMFGSWTASFDSTAFDIHDVTIAGVINPSSVTIERCSLDAAGLVCDLTGHVNLDRESVGIEGSAHIDGDLLPLAALIAPSIPKQYHPKEAALSADITVTGTIDDPVLNLSASVPVLRTDFLDVSAIMFSGEYRQKIAQLDTLRFGVFGGVLHGRGYVEVDSLMNHSFTLAMDNVRLERIWEYIYNEKSPYKGRVEGDLVTAGPLAHPEQGSADAGLTVRDVTFHTKGISGFDTGISYRDSLLTCVLKQDATDFNASVKFVDESIQGTFGFHTTKPGGLAGFAKVFELYGSLDINGTIGGTIKEPVIDADFKGHSLRFHGFPLDSLSGGVRYENGTAVLDNNTFSGSLASVDSLTAPYRIPGLGGGVAFKGVLNGDVLDPTGRLELNFAHPSYNGYGIDSAEAVVTMAGKVIGIERLGIDKDSLSVDITGKYSFESSSGDVRMVFNRSEVYDRSASVLSPAGTDSTGTLGGIHVTFAFPKPDITVVSATGSALDIAALTPAIIDSLDTGGTLDFDLDFSGSLGKPAGTLALFIDQPYFREAAVDSLRGVIRLDPEEIRCADLSLYLGGQRTWANGAIGLIPGDITPVITRESVIDVKAEGRNFTAQLLRLVLPKEAVFRASSSYNLTCTGTLGKPHITGDLHMDEGELLVKPGSPAFHNVSFDAAFMDSILVLDSAEGLVESAPFVLRGRAETSDWESYRMEASLKLSGKEVLTGGGTVYADSLSSTLKLHGFDLALLKLVAPVPQDLTGTVFASVDVAGPYSHPEVNGSLAFSDVAFREPASNLPLRQGKASVRFVRDTVLLDSLSIMLNGGRIAANGQLRYGAGGIAGLEMTVRGSKLKFEKKRQYSLVIKQAALTCVKAENFYDVDGDFDFDESRITADFQAKSLLPFMQNAERPSQSPPPVFRQIRLNIRMHGGDKLWVDNNLARMRINSELELIGTAARPNVAGRFSVEEGYVLYLDRKFKINKGVMDFIDPNRINPIVDFQAETSVKSYQSANKTPYAITLAVTGPLDKVSVDLVSDPALDRSDIVTLLTVGATREQLTGRNTETGGLVMGDILKERAEMLSSRQISGFFSRKVGNMLGLEEISVEGNLFNIGKTSGPQLVASEKISDRVDITYTTTVGHVNEQSVRLDYRLNRFFSLEGQTDQKGRAGLDLKYRLKFK